MPTKGGRMESIMERFFGLHFDFHAGPNNRIGYRTEKEDIKAYIKAAKVDFIQCDCKGHPGYSSYPTKAGIPAPGIEKDNLKPWVEAAHECKIPIFMHYSGVIDGAYVKAHPESAAVYKADDTRSDVTMLDTDCISVFGPYVDDLMIPQLKELIDEYNIDGVWVDGDCWAVRRDYSKYAKPYLKDGMTTEEHNKVMHDGYIKFLKHYTDELHAHKPDFKVVSNWAYSSYIPEKPAMDLDFLSGDFPCNDSAHVARYEGRCLAAQNMSWDLMAWGFENGNGYTDKPAVQLCQEAASVLSLGGGFQIYIPQNKDGSASKRKDTRLETVSEFMQKRRALNFKKAPIAQTAVYYSATARYKKSNIFNAAGATNDLIGMLNCTIDAKYTANILLQFQLNELKNYEIVLVPAWDGMESNEENALLDYAKNGGNLIISGAKNALRFASLCGLNIGKTTESPLYICSNDGNFSLVGTQNALCLESGTGDTYFARDLRDRLGAAFKTVPHGKGTVTFIPFELGISYFNQSNYILSEYLESVLRNLSAPIVEIDRDFTDITLQQDGDSLLVNLVNMQQGRHSLTENVYNEVTEILDITLSVRGSFKAVSMPLGEPFSFEILKDEVKIKLPRLAIHSIIRLEK